MNDAAQTLGFQLGGTYWQARGEKSTYQCCLTLWTSADQRSLLAIGGGQLGKLDYKRTTMISRLGSGKILYSFDEPVGSDLSGIRDQGFLLNASLVELNTFHQERVARSGGSAILFSASNLLPQFDVLNQERVEALVRKWLAQFREPTCNSYRYTFKGSWLNALDGLKTFNRATSQKGRVKIKRPGA